MDTDAARTRKIEKKISVKSVLIRVPLTRRFEAKLRWTLTKIGHLANTKIPQMADAPAGRACYTEDAD